MFFRDKDQDISRALGFILAVADDKHLTLAAKGWWGSQIFQSFVTRDHASIQQWLTDQMEANRRVAVLTNYTSRFLDYQEPYPHDFAGTSWLAFRVPKEVLAQATAWENPAATAIVSATDCVCVGWKAQRTLQMHQVEEMAARMRKQMGRDAVSTCYMDVPFFRGARLVRFHPGYVHEVSAFKPTPEEKAIEREYEKAMAQTMPMAQPPQFASDDDFVSMDAGIEFAAMDDVSSKSIEWLWRQKLAIGKLNLLGGMPGLGKSQVTLALAASVSKGGVLPNGERAPGGRVLILASEDDAADTIKPRLAAAGADMRNVFVTNAAIDLSDDFTRLKAMVEKIGGVRLIILDPIARYVNAGANPTVRRSLDKMIQWAQSARIALLGIMHPPKGERITNVQNLFGGSAAFVQLCRGAWMCLPSGEDGLFYFLFAKGNIFSEEAKRDGLAYRIEGVNVGGVETSRIVWQPGRVDMTADDALAQGIGQNGLARKEQPKPKPESNRYSDSYSPQEVEAWLRERIARGGGAVDLATLRAEADSMGISPPKLYRAKDALRIKDDDTDDRLNNGKVWALRH